MTVAFPGGGLNPPRPGGPRGGSSIKTQRRALYKNPSAARLCLAAAQRLGLDNLAAVQEVGELLYKHPWCGRVSPGRVRWPGFIPGHCGSLLAFWAVPGRTGLAAFGL